jgi:hypothetical protein
MEIIGIVISIAIAIWEHHKAKLAEKHFENLVKTLPQTLINGVADAIKVNSDNNPNISEWSIPGSKSEESPWIQTRFADINGDGTDELLVEMISGPHHNCLLVYGRVEWEFEKIAELYSTTGFGFNIVDLDNDGVLEVETIEIAERPNLPYVFGLRDRVIHKLIKNEFVEVGRIEGWDDSDVRNALSLRDTDDTNVAE